MIKKDFLDKIRKPSKELKLSKKVIYSLLFLLFGISLGIFSKWLDTMAIDDAIWWHRILDVIDLRNIFSEFGIWILISVAISIYSRTPLRAGINVFLFFLGMTTSYHLYTIIVSGFNPKSYMIIWYTITLITPIFAYICWYAKGNNIASLIISSGILAVVFRLSFGIGMWYFDFKSVIDTLIFIGTLLILYNNPKNTIFSLIIGTILAYLIRILL